MSTPGRIRRLPAPRSEPAEEAPDKPGDAVHVWTVPVATRYEPRAWLTADERARRDRYRQAPDRMRFATGRALARRALAHYTGASPADIRFTIDDHGRPHPDPTFGLDCNLSHAGDLVACCVAHARCGIDVERVRALPERDALARLTLGPEHDIDDDDALFAHWVLGEAWAKADGRGLGLAIDRVRLTDDGDATYCGARWQPRADHHLAVVAEYGPVCTVRWFAHVAPLR